MPARDLRRLTVLLAVAFAVSVVHYADNYGNYDAYPSGGTLPDPSAGLILASWFAFTAFGIAGYVLARRGELGRAAVCLAVYSGSGLVGFGHYTVPGAFDMPWWRQLHIVADIALGIAIFAVAVQLARAWRRRAAPAGA